MQENLENEVKSTFLDDAVFYAKVSLILMLYSGIWAANEVRIQKDHLWYYMRGIPCQRVDSGESSFDDYVPLPEYYISK